METNWIIIAIVVVLVIVLILYIIKRNQKDKDDVITSLNTQEDMDHESDFDKDIE